MKFPEEFISAGVRDLQILNLGITGLPKDQLTNLASRLLNKTDSMNSSEEKQPYFDKLIEIRCGNDSNIINQLHLKLITLKSIDALFVTKNYGKKRLFNLAQRKELES